METTPPSIRLAIIGCGAIVEKTRLPALDKDNAFEVAALVDSMPGRAGDFAGKLADGFGKPAICSSIEDLPKGIDAALVATPNHLHADQAIKLLERGIHVCVEKPLAPDSKDCQRMIDAAQAHGRVLMTALDRRYRPQYLQVRQLIQAGALGAIHHIDIREGFVHDWPSVSGFYTDLGASGGGVLLDAGIHALDQLLWWLGEPANFRYADDACGGPETECRLELEFANGTAAKLEFSRLRKLGASTEIHAEAGTLTFAPWSANIDFIPAAGHPDTLPDVTTDNGPPGVGAEGAVSLWRDFAHAIRTGTSPRSGAEDGLVATRLVERCYAARTPLARPWRDTSPAIADDSHSKALASLRGRRVLVTGGSGFLGGRIVEKLRSEFGAEVNVLTRSASRGMRVSRTGARIFAGDISNPAAVSTAAQGCDLIIHCARDDSRDESERLRKTLEGTRHVMDAALENNVSRMVHVSSMVVYRRPEGPSLDESSPRWSGQSIYERLKCDSEEMVLQAMASEGLRATIVQPTIIYGPFGGWWTRGQLQRLGQRRLVLPEDVAGACNLVYVDDAADAILLAAVAESAVGESFLVSGSQAVSWLDYFRALDRVRGGNGSSSVKTLPLDELLEQRSGEAAKADKSVEYADDHFLDELRFPAAVSITKAREVLGYRPAFDLANGMQCTRLWAEWQGIVTGCRAMAGREA